MEHTSGSLGPRDEVLLVKYKIILGHTADGDHPFNLRRFHLHIDSPFRQAADCAVEFLSDIILHIFHKLVFHALALGVSRQLLPHRGVLALVFVCQFVLILSSLRIDVEETVYHHIGVAPDGGGEVGVVFESQTVVPHIVGAVAGSCHTAQGQHLEYAFLGFAA